MAKAIRALLTDYEDRLGEFGSEDRLKLSEKMDALEVTKELGKISLIVTTVHYCFTPIRLYAGSEISDRAGSGTEKRNSRFTPEAT